MSSVFSQSRLAARDEIFTAFGMLASPIHRAATDVSANSAKVPFLRAQFRKDYKDFERHLWAYGTVNGTEFTDECLRVRDLSWKLYEILASLEQRTGHGDEVERVQRVMEDVRAALARIPMDDPDVILPRGSPFTSYLTLRSLCAGARTRVDLIDPYLDEAPFHRYMSAVDPSVPISVTTSEALMVVQASDARSVRRRDRIVSVSELLADERPIAYRFLVANGIHDRHLRIDDQIFHLGGSVKDAAKTTEYTIGRLDPTVSNHAAIDSVLSTATVWFGSGVAAHRTN